MGTITRRDFLKVLTAGAVVTVLPPVKDMMSVAPQTMRLFGGYDEYSASYWVRMSMRSKLGGEFHHLFRIAEKHGMTLDSACKTLAEFINGDDVVQRHLLSRVSVEEITEAFIYGPRGKNHSHAA
jgi:hypothetical protein